MVAQSNILKIGILNQCCINNVSYCIRQLCSMLFALCSIHLSRLCICYENLLLGANNIFACERKGNVLVTIFFCYIVCCNCVRATDRTPSVNYSPSLSGSVRSSHLTSKWLEESTTYPTLATPDVASISQAGLNYENDGSILDPFIGSTSCFNVIFNLNVSLTVTIFGPSEGMFRGNSAFEAIEKVNTTFSLMVQEIFISSSKENSFDLLHWEDDKLGFNWTDATDQSNSKQLSSLESNNISDHSRRQVMAFVPSPKQNIDTEFHSLKSTTLLGVASVMFLIPFNVGSKVENTEDKLHREQRNSFKKSKVRSFIVTLFGTGFFDDSIEEKSERRELISRLVHISSTKQFSEIQLQTEVKMTPPESLYFVPDKLTAGDTFLVLMDYSFLEITTTLTWIIIMLIILSVILRLSNCLSQKSDRADRRINQSVNYKDLNPMKLSDLVIDSTLATGLSPSAYQNEENMSGKKVQIGGRFCYENGHVKDDTNRCRDDEEDEFNTVYFPLQRLVSNEDDDGSCDTNWFANRNQDDRSIDLPFPPPPIMRCIVKLPDFFLANSTTCPLNRTEDFFSQAMLNHANLVQQNSSEENGLKRLQSKQEKMFYGYEREYRQQQKLATQFLQENNRQKGAVSVPNLPLSYCSNATSVPATHMKFLEPQFGYCPTQNAKLNSARARLEMATLFHPQLQNFREDKSESTVYCLISKESSNTDIMQPFDLGGIPCCDNSIPHYCSKQDVWEKTLSNATEIDSEKSVANPTSSFAFPLASNSVRHDFNTKRDDHTLSAESSSGRIDNGFDSDLRINECSNRQRVNALTYNMADTGTKTDCVLNHQEPLEQMNCCRDASNGASILTEESVQKSISPPSFDQSNSSSKHQEDVSHTSSVSSQTHPQLDSDEALTGSDIRILHSLKSLGKLINLDDEETSMMQLESEQSTTISRSSTTVSRNREEVDENPNKETEGSFSVDPLEKTDCVLNHQEPLEQMNYCRDASNGASILTEESVQKSISTPSFDQRDSSSKHQEYVSHTSSVSSQTHPQLGSNEAPTGNDIRIRKSLKSLGKLISLDDEETSMMQLESEQLTTISRSPTVSRNREEVDENPYNETAGSCSVDPLEKQTKLSHQEPLEQMKYCPDAINGASILTEESVQESKSSPSFDQLRMNIYSKRLEYVSRTSSVSSKSNPQLGSNEAPTGNDVRTHKSLKSLEKLISLDDEETAMMQPESEQSTTISRSPTTVSRNREEVDENPNNETPGSFSVGTLEKQTKSTPEKKRELESIYRSKEDSTRFSKTYFGPKRSNFSVSKQENPKEENNDRSPGDKGLTNHSTIARFGSINNALVDGDTRNSVDRCAKTRLMEQPSRDGNASGGHFCTDRTNKDLQIASSKCTESDNGTDTQSILFSTGNVIDEVQGCVEEDSDDSRPEATLSPCFLSWRRGDGNLSSPNGSLKCSKREERVLENVSDKKSTVDYDSNISCRSGESDENKSLLSQYASDMKLLSSTLPISESKDTTLGKDVKGSTDSYGLSSSSTSKHFDCEESQSSTYVSTLAANSQCSEEETSKNLSSSRQHLPPLGLLNASGLKEKENQVEDFPKQIYEDSSISKYSFRKKERTTRFNKDISHDNLSFDEECSQSISFENPARRNFIRKFTTLSSRYTKYKKLKSKDQELCVGNCEVPKIVAFHKSEKLKESLLTGPDTNRFDNRHVIRSRHDEDYVEFVSSRVVRRDVVPDVALSFSLLAAANKLKDPVWQYSCENNIANSLKQKKRDRSSRSENMFLRENLDAPRKRKRLDRSYYTGNAKI